jgi:hypothetical protein
VVIDRADRECANGAVGVGCAERVDDAGVLAAGAVVVLADAGRGLVDAAQFGGTGGSVQSRGPGRRANWVRAHSCALGFGALSWNRTAIILIRKQTTAAPNAIGSPNTFVMPRACVKATMVAATSAGIA